MSSIKDSNLASKGAEEINWATRQMQVLEEISNEFALSKPLDGLNIGACMHVTKETANLTKNSVLNQSAMAMVAQANQAQSAVLAVLN